MQPHVVLVAGATGLVGREIVRCLESRPDLASEVRAYSRSAAPPSPPLRFRDRELPVAPLEQAEFTADLAFFATPEPVSRHFCPRALDGIPHVIDNSPAFRQDPEVPLIVPDVNGHLLREHRLVANPNCVSIMTAIVVKPLLDLGRVRRISVYASQAVSGAGRRKLGEFQDEIDHLKRGTITFEQATRLGNVWPHDGGAADAGYLTEERKIQDELPRILELRQLTVHANCERVPVLRAHVVKVEIEYAATIRLTEVQKRLARAPRVRLVDVPDARSASTHDDVGVGRIRVDRDERVLQLTLSADQIRRGAALNAIEIAEKLIFPQSMARTGT